MCLWLNADTADGMAAGARGRERTALALWSMPPPDMAYGYMEVNKYAFPEVKNLYNGNS